MLKFHADKFLVAIHAIEFINTIANKEKEIDLVGPLKPYHSVLIKHVEILIDILIQLDLKLSLITAKELREHIRDNYRLDDLLIHYTSSLNKRLVDELDSRLFLAIMPGGREKYYNPNESVFGNDIALKFTDMVEDITEAGNCFALDRFTACVFHLMRVMENAVQKIADKVGIPLTITYDMEWQSIINKIRKELNILYPKHSNPERVKYESILGYLETVKIAWRNPTMHPKATYTEEESRALMDTVKIFLKELSKVL